MLALEQLRQLKMLMEKLLFCSNQILLPSNLFVFLEIMPSPVYEKDLPMFAGKKGAKAAAEQANPLLKK